MPIKTHIPNGITLLNLLSGMFSVYFSLTGNVRLAAVLVFAAALFDFFDGFVARLLHAKTPIGADLDSLADVVSFGVAPGFILFQMLRYSQGQDFLPVENPGYLPFVAFVIPLFGALRLAKFNVDDSQTDSFKGLPIPAQAIAVASFPLIVLHCLADNHNLYWQLLMNPWFLAGSGLLLSVLMVSRLPMFSMKFKGTGWEANRIRYVFLLLGLGLFVWLHVAAVPLIVLIYLLISTGLALRK